MTDEFESRIIDKIHNLPPLLRSELLGKLNPLHYDYVVFYPPYESLSPGALHRIDFQEIKKPLSDANSKLSFYFEIPWCMTKCPFCLYYKYKCDDKSDIDIEGYLEALISELQIYQKQLDIKKGRVHTVYIGGGTPSLLPNSHLRRFLEELNESIDLGQLEELSFEIYCPSGFRKFKEAYNTLTQFVDSEKLRISLGVQSFLPERRRRIRGVKDIPGADDEIRRIINFGLDRDLNVNIDLMWGLKHQPKDGDEERKPQIEDVGRELEVVEGNKYLTALLTFYQIEPPYDVGGYARFREQVADDVDLIIRQRCAIFAKMKELGYESCLLPWYFKRTGSNRTALYNSAQMEENHSFIGLGVASHTKLPKISFTNTLDIDKYCRKISKGELPIEFLAALDKEEEYRRDLLLGLRIPYRTFREEDLKLVFKDKDELITQFFDKDRKDNCHLNEIGRIVVDELIRIGVSREVKPIQEQVKRKVRSYAREIRRSGQQDITEKMVTEILEFSLHCLNDIASEAFGGNYFLNAAMKSKKWSVFGGLPLGLRKCKQEWDKEYKKFEDIPKDDKFQAFSTLFEKIIDDGSIGEFHPLRIRGNDISELEKRLVGNDVGEAKRLFFQIFGHILHKNTRVKVNNMIAPEEIKDYLYIMRLFNIYVKEVKEVDAQNPSDVDLVFSVFRGLVSEFVAGYVLATGRDSRIEKEEITMISSYFEDILNFLADIENVQQTQLHARRSAVAAIMARNMSHNIGSHVLSNLATEIRGWGGQNLQKKQASLSDFQSYLQTRMDFLARVSTRWPCTTVPFDFWSGVLNPFITQEILLDYIGTSEGLTKDKIKIHFTSNNKGKSEFVSIPESIVGIHAVYTILENFIRNSAKHGYSKKNRSNLEISITLDDYNDNSWKVEIWDNVSDGAEEGSIDKLVQKIEEKIIKGKLIDENGEVNEEDRGIKEMKIAAAFLNRMEPEAVDSKPDQILKPFKSKNNTLGYEFYLEKAKFLMIVDKNRTEEDTFQNGIYLTSALNPEDLRKPLPYQFLILNEPDKGEIEALGREIEKRDWIPFRTLIINPPNGVSLPKRFYKLASTFSIGSFDNCSNKAEAQRLIINIYREWLGNKMITKKYHLILYLGEGIDEHSSIFKQWESVVNRWQDLIEISMVNKNNEAPLQKALISPDNSILLLRHGGKGLSIELEKKSNENKDKFFYYENFEIGRPILDALLNNTKEEFYADLVISEIIEGALMKVVIVDERLAMNAENVKMGAQNLRKVAKQMGIIIPSHINVNGKTIELFNAKDKFEITFMEEGKVKGVNSIDVLSIHQGVIDKFPASIKNKIEEWIKKLKENISFVVVHSGRGKPENVSKNVKFIEFSPLQWYISTHPSKTFLVQTLLSIAGEAK